jgi:transglycosylase-like protein with SLT domain
MNLTLKAATKLIIAVTLLTLFGASRSFAAADEWSDSNSDASWSDSKTVSASPPEDSSQISSAPGAVIAAPTSQAVTPDPVGSASAHAAASFEAVPSTAVVAPQPAPAVVAVPATPVNLSIAPVLSAPSGPTSISPRGLTSISKDPNDAPTLLSRSPFVHSEPRAAAPFPLLLNQAVRNYVEDFVDQPKGLELAFTRSRPFFPEMVEELKAQGVPDDLVYLTFAESDFSKGGKGPWQFTFDTAARFGLRVNKWLDERRDPILSTRAAAEYLAELHDQADNDWRVAVIAWNTGEGNLNRYWLLEGATNYTKFADRLPRRTRQLLNRFMAVAFIAHNSATYGIGQVGDTEGDIGWTTQQFRGGTLLSSIARKFETTVSKLHELNPALRTDRVPPNLSSYVIRVPSDDDSY